jgi:hypothetical protein
MSIYSYIRDAQRSYESDFISVVEGYEYNQLETIQKATLYWASKYVNGDYDEILGKLPFDNVVIGAVEKEAQATDFDTKDIVIRPMNGTNYDRWKAKLSTKALNKHLEEIRFAKTLNQICHTRALYGGVLVKKTEKGTKVVPWQNVITDQSDIANGIIIERHYYTPAELKEKKGWKNIDEAIRTAKAYRAVDMSDDTELSDTFGDLIEVWELHGVIPKKVWDEEAEMDEYERRMMVVVGANWVETNKDGDTIEGGIILYNEPEKESPYKYNARNAIPGRGLGVGVVESLFETQTWHNFTLSEQFRAMAMAGKQLFDSDNPKIAANLYKLPHGTVLKRTSEHSPTTLINTMPSGLPMYDGLRQEIRATGQEIVGQFDAVTGKSNVNKPLGVVAIENIEGHSRFEQEREEIGELVEEIIRDWELPEAIKKMQNEKSIYAAFDAKELLEIDEIIMNKGLIAFGVSELQQGRPVTPESQLMEQQRLSKQLSKQGMNRVIEDIKGMLDDKYGTVKIITTSESRDRQAWFQDRTALLAYLTPEDPRYSAIVDSIMDEMGITLEDIQLAVEKNVAPASAPARQPEIGQTEVVPAAEQMQ